MATATSKFTYAPSCSSLLRKLVTAFETIAPLHLADSSWDNVGVLMEAPYPNENQQSIFLTIDLTPSVLEEVLRLKTVGVVVSYHPTIFRPWKNLSWSYSDNDPEALKKSMLMKLAAHGISLFSPHTALDNAYQGINDWLASAFPDIAIIKPIVPTPQSTLERPEGQGRLVTFAPAMDLSTLLTHIKKHLNLNQLRVGITPDHHPITTLGICAGSGGSLLKQCTNIDAFWTGEISHHDVLHALPHTHVIASEHSHTERGYLAHLKHRLEKEFQFHVIQSQEDREPLCLM